MTATKTTVDATFTTEWKQQKQQQQQQQKQQQQHQQKQQQHNKTITATTATTTSKVRIYKTFCWTPSTSKILKSNLIHRDL